MNRPPVPEDLTNEEKRSLMRYCKREAPYFYRPEALRYIVKETLDYHRGQGNRSKFTDWLAVIRNRVRSLEGRNLDEFARPRRTNEKPQEPRAREHKAQPRLIADVVNLADWKGK